MKRLYTLFTLVALLLASCTEQKAIEPIEQTTPPRLSVDIMGIITMEAAGGDVSIPYTITDPQEDMTVEAASEQDWIGNISVGESVTFSVDTNHAAEQRVGTVVISYGAESVTIAIQQEGNTGSDSESFVITSERKVSYSSKGGEGVITYTIEDGYNTSLPAVTSNKEWLTIGNISSTEAAFTVARNTTTEKRNAKVTISYLGTVLTVFVDQEAASTDLTLSVDKACVKSGEAVTFTVIYEDEDVTDKATIYTNYTNEVVSNPFTPTESGDYSFYAKYNGAKSKLCSIAVVPAYAPEFPEDSAPESFDFNQRMLLVDHTGLGCGYCPYMKEAIKSAEENANYKDKFNVVYSYSYSSSEVCYSSTAKTLFYYYQDVCQTSTTGMYLTGYPSLTSNYNHNTAANFNMVTDQIDALWEENPTASIALAAKLEGDKIVVSASVKSSVSQNIKLSLWMLEDDIYASQSNATASWMHNHHSVLRDAPTGVTKSDISGIDFGYVEAGTTLSRVLEFDLFLGSSWVRNNMKVIAIISAPSQKYDNKYEVVTTAMCDFGASVGFDYKK